MKYMEEHYGIILFFNWGIGCVYRRQQMLYRVDDVYSHADDLGIEISEEEAEQIAEKFIENYDCNVAENDLFRELIRDFNKNRKRN